MADFLIKAGADIELGCSTPLMEAAQEGHLELVKYLLAAGEHKERRRELQTRTLSHLKMPLLFLCAYNPHHLFCYFRGKCSCHHGNR